MSVAPVPGPASCDRSAAEALAGAGLPVFPLTPRGKEPGVGMSAFYDRATADPLLVAVLWASQPPDANVAVATGTLLPSGRRLIALDVDERVELRGLDVLAELEAQLGRLPDTATCLTGRLNGSLHKYLAIPADVELRSIKLDPLGGVQVKGHHSYVVGPGSVHPITGGTYEWEAGLELDTVGVADMPDGWLRYCTSRNSPVVERTHAPVPEGRGLVGDQLPAWPELLSAFGATYAGTKWIEGEPRQAWTRPAGGSPATHEVSAVVLDAGLWVYTSAWPTLAGTTLEPSEVTGHTLSRHGFYTAMTEGDTGPDAFRRSTAKLAEQFGMQRPQSLLHPSFGDRSPDATVLPGPWATAPPVEPVVTSWRLTPLDDFDSEPQLPELIPLGDGHLLYRGRVHSLIGMGESGKTWLALHGVKAVLEAGGRVAYIDHENGRRALGARLVAMGVPRELIAAGVLMGEPDEPLFELRSGRPVANAVAMADYMAAIEGADLVVVDGVTESLAMHGLSGNSGTDIAAWLQAVCRVASRAGAAVVSIDHVGVDPERSGRPVGSGHKRNGIDVLLEVIAVRPMARGVGDGMAKVLVRKDRPGQLRAIAQGSERSDLARFHVSSAPDRDEVRTLLELAQPHSANATGPDGEELPVRADVLERLSRLVEMAPGCRYERGDLQALAKVRRADFDPAVSWLVTRGHLVREQAGRRAVFVHAEPYRAPTNGGSLWLKA